MSRGHCKHLRFEKHRAQTDHSDPRIASRNRELAVTGLHKIVNLVKREIEMASLHSGLPGAPILVVGDWRPGAYGDDSVAGRVVEALSKHFLIGSSSEMFSSSVCPCGGKLIAFRGEENYRSKICSSPACPYTGFVRIDGGDDYKREGDPVPPPRCGTCGPLRQCNNGHGGDDHLDNVSTAGLRGFNIGSVGPASHGSGADRKSVV